MNTATNPLGATSPALYNGVPYVVVSTPPSPLYTHPMSTASSTSTSTTSPTDSSTDDYSPERQAKRRRTGSGSFQSGSPSVTVLTEDEREGKESTIASLREALKTSKNETQSLGLKNMIHKLERDLAYSNYEALNKIYLEKMQSLEKAQAFQTQIAEAKAKQEEAQVKFSGLQQQHQQAVRKHTQQIDAYVQENSKLKKEKVSSQKKEEEFEKTIKEQTLTIESFWTADKSRKDLAKEVDKQKARIQNLESQVEAMEAECVELKKNNGELAYDREIYKKGFDDLNGQKEEFISQTKECEISHKRKIEELETSHKKNLDRIAEELNALGSSMKKNAESVFTLAKTVDDLSSIQ